MTTKHVITLPHQLTRFGAVVSTAVTSGGGTAPHWTIRVKRGLCYTLHLREWQQVPIWRGKFCLPLDRVVCLKALGVRCQWRSLPAGPSGRVSVFTDLHFDSLLLFFRGQSRLTGLQRPSCLTLHENQGTRGSRGRNWPVWVPHTDGVRVEHVGWQLWSNRL